MSFKKGLFSIFSVTLFLCGELLHGSCCTPLGRNSSSNFGDDQDAGQSSQPAQNQILAEPDQNQIPAGPARNQIPAEPAQNQRSAEKENANNGSQNNHSGGADTKDGTGN